MEYNDKVYPQGLKMAFNQRKIYWFVFWILVLFLVCGLLAPQQAGNILLTISSATAGKVNLYYLLLLFAVAILSWGIILYSNPLDLIRKQKIYNLPSWIYFAHAPVVYFIIVSIFILLRPTDTYIIIFGLPAVLLLLYALWFEPKILPRKVDSYDSFSDGAVGVGQDQRDFRHSAANIGKGLLQLERPVNVVHLDGDMGQGKSSYVRMIIEQLPAETILYTHISLTETNKTEDFGKIFTKRWLNTLSGRYPLIGWLRETNRDFLNSIFLAKDERFWVSIVRLLFVLDKPLFPVKAKIWDPQLNKNVKDYAYVSEEIARHFLGIPEIKEQAWIIVIDELERASLDEVLRVIEVVERFKLQGRTGLPVKLIFLLCSSEKSMRQKLAKFSSCEQASLIDEFLFKNPRNIDRNLPLPIVDERVKMDFVDKQIQNMRVDDNLKK